VVPIRSSLSALDREAAVGAAALVLAMAVDLVSKAVAIHQGGYIIYNDIHAGDIERRILMSAAAIAFTCVAAVVARRRGIGRLWGAWIGAGLLVGGVMANGVSQFIWSRGVPDFIHVYSVSPDVWNVADFEIWWGLMGGLASIVVAAVVAFARERHPRRDAPLSES